MPGQVNVVTLQPGVTIAWHRHERQDDHLYVVQGTVKVGTVRSGLARFEVLSEWGPRDCYIPRGIWHGYKNLGPERAIVVGYCSQKYDPTDEQRKSIADMAVDWDTVEK